MRSYVILEKKFIRRTELIRYVIGTAGNLCRNGTQINGSLEKLIDHMGRFSRFGKICTI